MTTLSGAAPSADDPVTTPQLERIVTVLEFQNALTQARFDTGNPSYQFLAKRSGLSKSTVFETLRTTRPTLPVWPTVSRVLEALGVTERRELDRWRQAWSRIASQADTDLEEESDHEGLGLQAGQLGLYGIFGDRDEAMRAIWRDIESEVRAGPNGRLWIVGSSLKGFLLNPARIDLLKRAVKLGCDLRILCTYPGEVARRAAQEGRSSSSIPAELKINLTDLRNEAKVELRHVKWLMASPTVFGICTTDRMLLNPYPYGQEAYLSFSIVVRATPNDADGNGGQSIFEHYEQVHFARGWEQGREIEKQDWDEYESDTTAS